ncbi:unnamed protein product [Thlaspi arvense]|uniref:ATVPS33 vacuolar protein sorting 33 n=1 Tax=Thlaspi arvense TaxID=13288 RepID=A0AAU9RT90_THLAR|nr:unnamed protein product [Thlaspi arvense]
MAQIPNLDNAPVNLSSIREQSQKELITILKNIRGKKCLVVDPKLGGSLSLIVQTSLLKALQILEEEKVHHLMTIGEYPLYVVPLDEDVLSFELDLASKEYAVDGDTSALWHIAKAIHKLEFSFGLIPNVRAKGKASVCVAEILNRMQAEEPVNISDVAIPEINTLILLDREVDMVTPMCSQLTYEGLLDEQQCDRILSAYGSHQRLAIHGMGHATTWILLLIPAIHFLHVNNGAAELDASIMGVQQQEGKKMKVPLNSSDKLFKEIRDLNFEVVVQVLRQKATSMKQDYTEISSMTQTVSELKDFVKKLNSLPEMTRHINLAQYLSTFTSKPSFLGRLDMEHTLVEAQSYDICFEYIEEMIHKQEPLVNVLRLLILFSVTNAGLPKKNFDYLRQVLLSLDEFLTLSWREILHSYGFEHMATLNNLEKAGLLRKQESKSNWLTIKRALQLVVDDTDTANPNDISYVFSGYAPLSIRLVQHAVRSGWRPVEEILKLLPGPHSETKRVNFLSSLGDGRRSQVLVVFIGGVTFAEISALRYLSAQSGVAAGNRLTLELALEVDLILRIKKQVKVLGFGTPELVKFTDFWVKQGCKFLVPVFRISRYMEGMAYDLVVGTTKIVSGSTLTETFIEKLG